ncbi:MAG: gamma-glutamyltransferase family protein [Desulfobacteraceae bacterium]|nr:gamma-glutamyltransferase family protein [Desulfobacteraceae bacterium]
MDFDPLFYPYPSRRSVVFAGRGMVATSQPLAAQAGLEILKKGGNAIDAAVAAAACLTVVEPTSNGIGGDAFALVWTGSKIYGLNSSGPAPKMLSLDALKRAGHKEMPRLGVSPVTVPGAPACWAALTRRFGRLALTESLLPAIEYARNGFPVSPIVSELWAKAFDTYSAQRGEVFKHWFEAFAPLGRAPRPGEIWRQPDQAATLEAIAGTDGETFYRGAIAKKIGSFFKRYEGYLSEADLGDFQPEWVEPIRVNYRGYEVWEIPPNGHGIVALMALNILNGFEKKSGSEVEGWHRKIEAVKLAFADGLKYVADARSMNVSLDALLSESYAAERRKRIGAHALTPEPGNPVRGGTVYLAAADGEGNMVSYIQSNYEGFGAGIVVPGTGISLHNRGFCFSSDPSHVNCVGPGKKPYHTIIPGFLAKDGKALGPFGVMGGFIQPQGHVMVVTNTIDLGLNPQAALDAPRFRWTGGKTVELEANFPQHIAEALKRMGHDVRYGAVGDRGFGRGQIIWRNEEGVLAGGSEPRTDGQVAAW